MKKGKLSKAGYLRYIINNNKSKHSVNIFLKNDMMSKLSLQSMINFWNSND